LAALADPAPVIASEVASAEAPASIVHESLRILVTNILVTLIAFAALITATYELPAEYQQLSEPPVALGHDSISVT
jgi:hypothetical protein